MRGVVTIVDCGHGNLASVANAVRTLGRRPIITDSSEGVRSASALIFPGQGAAPPAMRSMQATGLDVVLLDSLRRGVPSLGICLGMQLLLESSREGPTRTLGLLAGQSLEFESGQGRKVPQIGWNTVRHAEDPLFADIVQDAHFYFVHSFYCEPPPDSAIGWTDYGAEYVSALRVGNTWATQFHPEKSGAVGLKLLTNFLDLASC